jgi:endonuclease/exonuclease/phosphatase family metal-dependent hydrolase
MRLLTVNIHKGFSAFSRRSVLHGLREAVRGVGSDVVLLQEVEGASRQAAHAAAPSIGAQYEFLADEIWTDHAYGRNAVADGMDHGNAVLSRWPVLHSHNHDVSLPGHEPRGLLHCVLAQAEGTPALHVMCVHLGLQAGHRRQQIQRLLDVVARHVPPDAPLVVAGDFNDWQQQADTWLRASGLTEVFKQAQGAHARSFPAFWPLLRLDRIYVRGVGACRPLRLPRQPWAGLSDHLPLAVDIELTAAP